MQVRSISLLYFKQANANKQPDSIQNWDNATHVVKPKHQHLLVQYYEFASRLEDSHAVRIWELMQVRSISLPYFKQAIATKQPDSIQTETMQPMWCNPNISTYLFNTTGLHEGWEKNKSQNVGMSAGSHHLTTLFLSRQFQPNNLPVYKLCETVPTQPMWSNPNINIACPILRVCIKVGRKSCSYKLGIDAGSLHLTAIFQAGKCKQTTWQYTNWRQCYPCGATQTSARICSIPLVCTKVGRKTCSQNIGNECRFAPSHNFISKQAVTTKQPASIQVVRNCANATHVEQSKYQHCLSNTTGLHQGWKKVMQL